MANFAVKGMNFGEKYLYLDALICKMIVLSLTLIMMCFIRDTAPAFEGRKEIWDALKVRHFYLMSDIDHDSLLSFIYRQLAMQLKVMITHSLRP